MKNGSKRVAVAPFWIFPAPYEAQCIQEASGMHGLPQNGPKKFKNPLFRVLGVGPEIPPISLIKAAVSAAGWPLGKLHWLSLDNMRYGRCQKHNMLRTRPR